MSTPADILRASALMLSNEADKLDGKPAGPTYFGVPLNPANVPGWAIAIDAERRRLEEIVERMKPHAWRDAGPGVPITDVGDNDDSPEMDDLLRAFRPFCDAATREGQIDTTGDRFYVPNIKKRGGIGLQSVRLIRDEIRAKWYSTWGMAWRQHPLNANLLPKAEVVDALFSKDY